MREKYIKTERKKSENNSPKPMKFSNGFKSINF